MSQMCPDACCSKRYIFFFSLITSHGICDIYNVIKMQRKARHCFKKKKNHLFQIYRGWASKNKSKKKAHIFPSHSPLFPQNQLSQVKPVEPPFCSVVASPFLVDCRLLS